MNQMMLAVCAIILIGILLVPAHNLASNREQILMSTEATMVAVAVGQEFLEEILVRKFDENKCGRLDSTSNAGDFSAILGVETSGGDTLGKTSSYDDVDDFNGFQKTYATPRLGDFIDSCRVYYVTEDNPDVASPTPTFLKRIDITIRNPHVYSKDGPLIISKIISYRYKGGN